MIAALIVLLSVCVLQWFWILRLLDERKHLNRECEIQTNFARRFRDSSENFLRVLELKERAERAGRPAGERGDE